MSVSKWAYEPEKCDYDYCPGSCDICPKAEIDSEHIPIWLVSMMLAQRFSKEDDRHEILDV